MITRRGFLNAALVGPAASLLQTAELKHIANVPLADPGLTRGRLERLIGRGLSARLSTDLSKITAADAVGTDRFFVRTTAPQNLPEKIEPSSWAIDIGGMADSPRVTAATLEALTPRSGRYLLECSGNSDPSAYGLLSTADWGGVPLLDLVDRTLGSAARPASRILVSGLDDDSDPGRTSTPGASWIFSRDDLSRALLALEMNGAPLPRDHGAPVRLIVPGWYGCACIKWVNRIALAPDDAAATTQMREFAARTHQPFDSRTALDSLKARDFMPAVIDTAAMPVRVEKWAGRDGRIFYQVIGIMWGGSKPTNQLSIRFKSNLTWTRVEHCPLPSSTDSWSIWTHTWRPEAPGRYSIVLRVDDRSIRTRRLDLYFYARDIQITET
jgi:DMSO/TMAO reductase YedYZ molybdopterin-dependent catalytic subunit